MERKIKNIFLLFLIAFICSCSKNTNIDSNALVEEKTFFSNNDSYVNDNSFSSFYSLDSSSSENAYGKSIDYNWLDLAHYEGYEFVASIGGQDGCSYGDYLFSFNSDNTFVVYNLAKSIVVGQYVLDGEFFPHCNTACFGREKFSYDDLFPLVYVNAYNNLDLPRGRCYAFRIFGNEIDGFKTQLVQTITLDFTYDHLWAFGNDEIRPYGNFVVDVTKMKLYAYTMMNSIERTRFFEFDLPRINDGENIILGKKDILKYFDTYYLDIIQGNFHSNGKIILCYGLGGSTSGIAVIDVGLEAIVSDFSLISIGIYEEPEKVFEYNGDLFFGSLENLYRIFFLTTN